MSLPINIHYVWTASQTGPFPPVFREERASSRLLLRPRVSGRRVRSAGRALRGRRFSVVARPRCGLAERGACRRPKSVQRARPSPCANTVFKVRTYFRQSAAVTSNGQIPTGHYLSPISAPWMERRAPRALLGSRLRPPQRRPGTGTSCSPFFCMFDTFMTHSCTSECRLW